MLIKVLMGVVLALTFFLMPLNAQARITPEDIVNSKKEAYEKRVVSYSPAHKKSLEDLSKKIAGVNKKRTDELERIMVTQALILDEYERRSDGKNGQQIKEARYWITYAHEAVAYQAAKIYIFELSGESNLTKDALNTVSFFQSELNSARSKVINSRKTLTDTLKNL